jgi:hypothetical protein
MLFHLLLLFYFIFLLSHYALILCLCIVGHSLVINEQTVSIHGELKLRQCGEACDRFVGRGEVRK